MFSLDESNTGYNTVAREKINDSTTMVDLQIPSNENNALAKNHSKSTDISSSSLNATNVSTSKLPSLEEVQYWPHWVIYFGWLTCGVVSAVAGFLTLLYGLSFGKNDQEKWLFSFFISVFSDIMFNQPMKVS